MSGEQNALKLELGRLGEYLVIGRGGWLYWHVPGLPAVRARLAPKAASDAWAVTTLVFDTYGPGTGPDNVRSEVLASDLREIPLGRLDALLAGGNIRASVKALVSSQSALDLDPLRVPSGAAYLATRELPSFNQVAEKDLYQITIPTGRYLGEIFYFELAFAYSLAAARTKSPAAAIAKANNVDVKDVYRWLAALKRRRSRQEAQRRAALAEEEAIDEQILQTTGQSWDDWHDEHQNDPDWDEQLAAYRNSAIVAGRLAPPRARQRRGTSASPADGRHDREQTQ